MMKYVMIISGIIVSAFGVVMVATEDSPVEKQAKFISCLEQNLENTQNDCLIRILKVKNNG
jgi:hypothetical protein